MFLARLLSGMNENLKWVGNTLTKSRRAGIRWLCTGSNVADVVSKVPGYGSKGGAPREQTQTPPPRL